MNGVNVTKFRILKNILSKILLPCKHQIGSTWYDMTRIVIECNISVTFYSDHGASQWIAFNFTHMAGTEIVQWFPWKDYRLQLKINWKWPKKCFIKPECALRQFYLLTDINKIWRSGSATKSQKDFLFVSFFGVVIWG